MPNPECNPETNLTESSADISGQVDNVIDGVIELVWGTESGGPYTELCDEEVGDNSLDQTVSCSLVGLSPGQQYCYRVQVRNAEDPEAFPWVDNMDGTFTKTFSSGVEITMVERGIISNGSALVTQLGPGCDPPASANGLIMGGIPADGPPCNAPQGDAPVHYADFTINTPGNVWGPKLGFRLSDFDNSTVTNERFRSPTHGVPDIVPPSYFEQPGGWMHAAANNATAEFTWEDPADGTFRFEFEGCCIGIDFSVFYTEASDECCFFTPPGPAVCNDDSVPINGATDITFTSATLNGASLTTAPGYNYRFHWGTASGGPYPFTSPIIPTDDPVEPDIFSYNTGDTLSPDTTYCYIIEILRPDGSTSSFSTECCFVTPAGAIWCGGLYDPDDCMYVDTASDSDDYFNCTGAEAVGP